MRAILLGILNNPQAIERNFRQFSTTSFAIINLFIHD